MSHKLILKPSAEKELQKLPKVLQRRIVEKLAGLQLDPRPAGAVKLAGASNAWRIRVGDYRIIYEIGDAGRTLFVTIIARRRDVYRGL